MAYEDIRNPDLPWGHWLTIHNVPGLPGPVVDEDGVGWKSVREAFWVSRMADEIRIFEDDRLIARHFTTIALAHRKAST